MLIRFLTFALLVVSAVLSQASEESNNASAPDASADASQLDSAIQEALAIAYVDERHSKLRTLARDNPKSQLAHLELGRSYFINQHRTALGIVGYLIFGGPTHATVHGHKTHLDEAEHHLSIASRLPGPQKNQCLYWLALVKLFRNRYGPTILYIEEILDEQSLGEYSAPTRQLLGIAYRQMHEFDKAIKIFSDLDPVMTLKHHNLAITYLLMGQPAKAAEELAAGKDAHWDETHKSLEKAIASEIEGNVEHAIERYRALHRRNARSIRHHFISINAKYRAHVLEKGN